MVSSGLWENVKLTKISITIDSPMVCEEWASWCRGVGINLWCYRTQYLLIVDYINTVCGPLCTVHGLVLWVLHSGPRGVRERVFEV